LNENIPLTQSSSTITDTSILMKNVSASWTTTKIVNTLHNINIQIKDKKLYAIIGPVGAGKVYLLNTFYIYMCVIFCVKRILIFILRKSVFI